MSERRDVPLLTGNFRVEIEGSAPVTLFAVMLPQAALDPGGRSGKVRYTSLVLRRPLSADPAFADWWKLAVENKQAVRNGRVVVFTPDAKPAVSWKFSGARPVSLAISDLKAAEKDILTECLELSVDSFERET